MLIILFFLLSLGTFYQLSIGDTNYNLLFIEILLLILFINSIYIRSVKEKDNKNYKNKTKSLIQNTLNEYNRVYFLLITIMIIYSVLTLVWSPFGISSLLATITYMYMLILFFIFSANNFTTESYFVANRFFTVSIFIQILLSLYRNDVGEIYDYYSIKHIVSTMLGNSNYLAVFVGLIFVSEIISQKKYWQVFSLISGSLVFLTLSKSGLLAIFISLFIYEIFNLKSQLKKNKKKVIFLIVFFFILGLIVITKSRIGNIFFNALVNAVSTGSLSGRELLISEAFKDILSYPMGMGYSIIGDPHNMLLISIRSFGILFGLVTIFIFLIPLVRGIKKNILLMSRTTKGLYFGYLTLVIHSMFEIFFFTNAATIWVTITIILLEREMENEYSSYTKL